jgi:GWxTD domain-containing protein
VIRSSARAAALVGLLLACACSSGAPPPDEQLSNVRLGPEYSQWLVGAIVRMSSREEVDGYLALRDDASAAAFIDAYWARRGAAVRRLIDQRAEEADRRFSEGGYAGRRTDRGAIFVLHGEPKEIQFEPAEFIDEPATEVWRYETSELGLNGKPPMGVYRFAKVGDLTVFYQRRVRRSNQDEPIR